jgi:lysozyme
LIRKSDVVGLHDARALIHYFGVQEEAEMLLGIDVSHYQYNVDWFAVAQGPVKFAFAKATEGSESVDPLFQDNWVQMCEVGLFRGAYHFGRPGGDPESQATHFASVLGTLGFRDLPPALDLEVDDGHPPEHVLAWARAFVTRAEALLQHRLIIYTGGFWRFKLGNPADLAWRAHPLWLAAYSTKPVVPAAWDHWTLWQYSDGTHNGPIAIPGVRGAVDQNQFAGDETALSTLCEAMDGAAFPMPSTTAGSSWSGQFLVWPHSPSISNESVRKWQARMNELGFGSMSTESMDRSRNERV